MSTKVAIYLREPGTLRAGIDRLWKMVLEDSCSSAAAAAAVDESMTRVPALTELPVEGDRRE